MLLLPLLLCAPGAYAVDEHEWGDIPDKRPVIKSFTCFFNKGELPEDAANRKPYEEPCSDFILKKSDVKEFFKKAQMITRRDHNVVLDTSRCTVGGLAVLADGRKVRWSIDRFRRGEMWINEGGATVAYYYCDDCSSKKYYEPCDMQCSMDAGMPPEQEEEAVK